MSRDEVMYLCDIADSCARITEYTAGLDRAGLLSDQKTYDAVVRNLEIVGEAAKHISEELRAQLPDVPWRKVAGMRDMLTHAYLGIDNDILWDVVQNKVPSLACTVGAYLSQMGGR